MSKTIVIDGKTIPFEEGQTIMEAATAAGGEISVVLDPQRIPKKDLEPKKHFYLSPLLPIGASVAVAGAGVALGFGISGKLALDDYEERCTIAGAPSSCELEQAELQSDLDGRAIAVDIALGLAGAGLITGTIGVFLTGATDEQKAALWQGKILF